MTKKTMTLSLCRECKVKGVILCTATVSMAGKCNRGALSLEEARERKRRSDEMWRSYLDAVKGRDKVSLMSL